MKLSLLALAVAAFAMVSCASKQTSTPPPVDMGMHSGK